MSKAPAFQFYANDFMDATRFWEAIAVGLYIRCLCIQWTQGGLPSDIRMLARGVGMEFDEFERAWPVVSSKFDQDEDGLLKNSRLETVRTRQENVSSKRSEAGKAGAIAKANAYANGQAKNKQRKVKVKVKEKVEIEKEEEDSNASKIETAEMMPWPTFEDFWAAYERKGNKINTAKEWAKLTQSEREAIMVNVPKYNSSKPDKQFRKDGERYLKNRVWEDEIVIPTNLAAKSQTKNQTNDEYAAAARRSVETLIAARQNNEG